MSDGPRPSGAVPASSCARRKNGSREASEPTRIEAALPPCSADCEAGWPSPLWRGLLCVPFFTTKLGSGSLGAVLRVRASPSAPVHRDTGECACPRCVGSGTLWVPDLSRLGPCQALLLRLPGAGTQVCAHTPASESPLPHSWRLLLLPVEVTSILSVLYVHDMKCRCTLTLLSPCASTPWRHGERRRELCCSLTLPRHVSPAPLCQCTGSLGVFVTAAEYSTILIWPSPSAGP